MDPVSKWLYLTRAGVLPMTLVAAAIAGLLAVYRGADVSWGWFAVAAAGIVLAHMANNLMNDLFDLEVGTDRADYPRNLYSPHPVLSGVITRRGLALCALAVNALCLAIMVVLTVARGWPIVGFALGGFLLSAAYTAPPLRLKKRGLGEPTVLVVWGPLMVGGVYYAATGTIPGAVVLASLPYALLCTTVLMGKHIDKIAWDAPDGTHTLPVVMGEAAARRLTQAMFVAFYVSIGALVIVSGAFGLFRRDVLDEVGGYWTDTVGEDLDQEAVSRIFRKSGLIAIPVIDAQRHMKGVVTVDDVVEVVSEEATEDIQKIGGSEALGEPYLTIRFSRMLKKRAGWLSALFLGEMLTATAMGFFEKEIDRAVVLALFVPLIISSGGNSGSQATSLVIRAMALGEVRLRDWFRVIRRELATGIALGSVLGSIGFLRIEIWQKFLHPYGEHHVLVALTVVAIGVTYNPSNPCHCVTDRLIVLEVNAGDRDKLLHKGLTLVVESPLLGTGVGSFDGLVADTETIGHVYQYPHNVPLEVAAETGLIGFLLIIVPLLVGWVAFFWSGIKRASPAVAGITMILAIFFVVAPSTVLRPTTATGACSQRPTQGAPITRTPAPLAPSTARRKVSAPAI